MTTRAEQIRDEILMQLYASRPLPLSVSRIERDARKGGYDYTKREILAEAHFLKGEDLCAEKEMPGKTELHFEITSHGVRHYEQNFQ